MREQRTVRRMIASSVMAAGVVLLGIGIAPGVASAHTPNVSDNCGGLAVSFTSYEGTSTNNQLTVTIDGNSQVFFFASGYSNTFPWSSAVNHSWSVAVDANRNSGDTTRYDWSASGTQVACNPTTSTSTSTSTTTSTTSTTTSTTTTTTQPPCVGCTPNTNVIIPTTTTTQPPCVDCTPNTNVTTPTSTTEPGATTTTVEQIESDDDHDGGRPIGSDQHG